MNTSNQLEESKKKLGSTDILLDSPPNNSKNFEWGDTTEPIVTDPSKGKDKPTWLPKSLHGVYKWFMFFSKKLLIALILLVPGIVGWIKTYNDLRFPEKNFSQNGYLYIYGYTMMFWSAFATIAYVVYEFCQGFAYVLPMILSFLLKCISASIPPKSLETNIEHLSYLRWYVGTFLFCLLFLISSNVIFVLNIQNQEQWVLNFINIVSSLFLISCLVLLQKLFVQIIAIRFHKKAYMERIDRVKFIQETVAKMFSEAKKILKEKEKIVQEIKAKKNKMNKSNNTHDLQNSNPLAKSWNLLPVYGRKSPKKIEPLPSAENVIIDAKSDGDINEAVNQMTATSIDLKSSDFKSILSDHSGSDTASAANYTFNVSRERFLSYAKHAFLSNKLTPYDAKRAAKTIYEGFSLETTKFLAEHGKDGYKKRLDSLRHKHRPEEECLLFEDFAHIFSNITEAHKVMESLDADSNGYVSRQELREYVLSLEKEKKGLSSSLRDVSSAVATLDTLLFVITLIISTLCILMIFGVPLYSFLVTSISLMVAVTFIFGNAAKNFFEGIIFLFITHPFDVGDRVFIDNVNYFVHEIGVLTTCLRRWDGQIIYSPNAVLLTKNIVNVRRSPNMMEVIELQIDVRTPKDKLNALKHKMLDWLHSESKNFLPSCELNIMGIQNMNKMTINIFLEHRNNWQDGEKRFDRHNRFLIQLKAVLEELEIGYSYPVQPIKMLQKT